MGWKRIENPSQEMLDDIMARSRATANRTCHDCGAKPGKRHRAGCDTAQCKICGGQRLQCKCKGGGGDIWSGMWPGTEDCYRLGLVCKWVGPSPFGTADNLPRFDFNELAVRS